MDFRRSSLACQASAALVCLILASFARADAFDPPASYYSTATGTGATLKAQLNDIIDGHTVRSYDSARMSLQWTDADLSSSDRIILIYNRESLDTSDIGSSIPGWDGSTWNREHTWPESRLGGGSSARTDLFNLRPSRNQINSDRGNLNFGGAYGQTYGVKNDGGATVWYPGNADAGMVARQAFYMAVRYDGIDSGGPNLEVVAGNPADSGSTMGNLNRLIEWHFAAPPDEFERRCNQLIFDPTFAYNQGNRNPFTDRPELAWSVFVDQANDVSLSWAGGVAGANGASTLNLDLGRRLVGSALPAGQSVSLNKTGVDGAYYSVTTAGAATSTVTGRYNAFTMGAAGTKVMTVGLAPGTSTATAGLQSGTVTIDNLDVTTAGGAGKGANDGNDVAMVNLAILDHANPSFSGTSDVNTLNFDFGTISLGAAAPTFAFSLSNLSATAGFTAGLDLDAIIGSGDTTALTTDLGSDGGVTPLAAGSSRSFLATLAASAVGDFSATYTLSFSDENLVGATSLGSLTLNLSGIVEASAVATGDFDADGDVDGQDFLAWQQGLGLSGGATRHDGDANGDLGVDAADLQIWQTQFASAPPANATPEPRASFMLPLAVLTLAAVRRSARSS